MSDVLFSNKLLSTALSASSSTSSGSESPSLIPRTFFFSGPTSPSALDQIAKQLTQKQVDDSRLSAFNLSSFIQCDGNNLVNAFPTQKHENNISNKDDFDEENYLFRARVCDKHSALGLDSRFETAALFSNFIAIQEACDRLRKALLLNQRKEEIHEEFVSGSARSNVGSSKSVTSTEKEHIFPREVHLVLVSDIDLCFQHLESSVNLENTNQTSSSPRTSPPAALSTASEALATFLSFASCTSCFNPSHPISPAVIIAISARHAKLIPPWLLLPTKPRRFTSFTKAPSSSSYLSFESTEPALVDSQIASYPLDNASISFGKIRADVWFNSSSKSRVHERVNGDAPVASKSSKLGNLVVGYENLREKLHSSVVLPLLDAVSMALRDSSSSNGGIDSEQKLASSSSTSSSSSSLPSSATPLKVSPCRGLLLHGPSGCGKTLLARSLAAEANLALIHVQCPQLLSKYVGDSEAGLREVFRTARAMAPSLLLLDDIDAIAKARSGLEVRLATTTQGEKNEKKTATSSAVFSSSSQPIGSNVVLERLLSTLLNELDGIGLRSSSSSKANLPILVVGTCSESSTLDAALLRSGRLELHVLVHSPGLSDRIAILQASAQKIKLSFNANEYLTEFAKELSGRSCAQVSKLLSEASKLAIEKEEPEVNIEYLKRVI
jgi:hypothetical protein